METSTEHANRVLDYRGQYLDVPEQSESATEARLRHIIRHRLGNCAEPDRGVLPDAGSRVQSNGNISPCELCLQQRIQRPANGDMTFSETYRGPDVTGSNGFIRSNSSRKSRRQSLQMSDMYTSTRSRADKPWTRSFKFSKAELNAFLPRKSFFNCHDKALKDAGYDTETPVRRKSGRRQNMEAVEMKCQDSEEEKKLPDPNKDNDEVLPSIVITASQSQDESPAVEQGVKGQNILKQAKLARKKMEDDFHKNEHKAVTEYLKYVKDNPSEYLEHLKQLEHAEIELKPVERLIKTASIFQRGHHGKARASPVVRASHDLKQRYTDPGQWQQVMREKSQILHQVFSFSKKESVLNKPSLDADKEGKQDPDEGKTELERARLRAEKWFKTVPMSQQLKARQMALEEVGEEDIESTQWWNALRSCHYIRNIGFSNNKTGIDRQELDT